MTYYLKKAWLPVSLTALCQIISYGIEVFAALSSMEMLAALLDMNFHQFFFWLFIHLAVWAISFAAAHLETIFHYRAVQKMNNLIRRDLMAALIRKNHTEFHSQESGAYLSQFTNDIAQIERLGWDPFFSLIGMTAQVISSAIALTTLHWSLLAVSLVTGVVMLLLPNLFKKKLSQLGDTCSQQQGIASSKLKDLLSGYDVLRFFGKHDRLLSGTEQASTQMEKARYRLNVAQSASSNSLGYLSVVFQCIIRFLAGVLILAGLLDVSVMVSVSTICSNVYNGLKQIVSKQLLLASSKPYFDKLKIHADDYQLAYKYGFDHLEEAITVENLSFTYDKKPILKQANFRFEKGKKYALTGPSGCGKSTLLKLLLGWLPGYTGYIFFDGKSARDYTPEQIQRQMSYIEQNVFLFNTTIRENITLGDDFTDEQLQRALQDSALAGDLANMPDGLDTVVGEEGSNLSGGQKQRVAIARALIHNRSILLVDEGTSALDQKNADIVEKSLLSNPNLTLILVSHHLTPERKQQFDHVYELAPAAPAPVS